jgi:hypothetical protein
VLSVLFVVHYPNVFSSLYVNMVRAGEASGQLEATLNRVAALLEYELVTKERVKAATRYPKLVIGALIAVFLWWSTLLFLPLPEYSNSLGQKFPAYTGNDRYGCVSQAILGGEFVGDGPLGGSYPLVDTITAGSLLARLAQSTHPHV